MHMCLLLSLVAAGLTLTSLSASRGSAVAGTSGVALLPSAGQFVPIDGTLVASISSGYLNSTAPA
jgi:hypothetical protein